MSWITYVLPQVRNYIGDPTGATYSDSRLTNIAITAAHSLLNEVSFDNVYSVDVPNSSISPDPTNSIIDTNFINLLSMKTSALVVGSEVRTKSLQIYNIKDGPSSISTGESAKALMELSRFLNESYNKAKLDYISGNSVGAAYVGGPVATQWANPSIFG